MQGTRFKTPDEPLYKVYSRSSGLYHNVKDTAVCYEHFQAELQIQGTLIYGELEC